MSPPTDSRSSGSDYLVVGMETFMSTAANKAIVKAFHGMAFNNGRPAEAVERFVRARYVYYGPMVVGGKEAFIGCFERLARDYPGKRVEFRHVIAEGDFVVLHCRHQWPNERDVDGIEIFRLDAFGNIVEHWGVMERIPERSPYSSAMP
jgi:predicted SnoaL-like aldol condensation-catalyzing enzyme